MDKLERIRLQEIQLVLQHVNCNSETTFLEVGCGHGYQSKALSEKMPLTVSVDIREKPKVRFPFVRCSADHLPFRPEVFSIVYSSCLLEHVPRRQLAISEMRRVLVPRGTLVCVVPSALWKIIQFLSHYIVTLKTVALRTRVAKPRPGASVLLARSSSKRRRNFRAVLVPPTHGAYKSNGEELRAYRRSEWMRLIAAAGFLVESYRGLLLYSPYSSTLVPPILRLERFGLFSSLLFLARKT